MENIVGDMLETTKWLILKSLYSFKNTDIIDKSRHINKYEYL